MFQTNAKRDRPDDRDFVYQAPREIARALPDSVDLRPKSWPVWNQGGMNSCTAQAVGGAMQFLHQDFDPSRLFVYYNSKRILEKETGKPVSKNDPVYMRDAIKAVAKDGCCPEKAWPYVNKNEGTKPPDEVYRLATEHKAIQYHTIPQDLTKLKACVAHGFPFTILIELYEGQVGALPPDGQIQVPDMANSVFAGGHAMLIVGYRDDDQRFIVRNSYGSDWGDDGYGTIPYDFVTDAKLADSFWVIRRAD